MSRNQDRPAETPEAMRRRITVRNAFKDLYDAIEIHPVDALGEIQDEGAPQKYGIYGRLGTQTTAPGFPGFHGITHLGACLDHSDALALATLISAGMGVPVHDYGEPRLGTDPQAPA